MKVYNGGKLVSRTIDVDLLRGPERLIEAIREACEDLEDVRFEVESEIYNYGDSRSHDLVIYGTPTGDLATWAVKESKREWGR